MKGKLTITSCLTFDFDCTISYEKFLSDYYVVVEAFNKDKTFFQKDWEPFSTWYLQILLWFKVLFWLHYESKDDFSYKMTYLEHLLFQIYWSLFYSWLDSTKAVVSWWLFLNVITETYSTSYYNAVWQIEDIKNGRKDEKPSALNLAYLCYIKSYCLRNKPHEKMRIFPIDTEWESMAKEMFKLDRSVWYTLRQVKYDVEFTKVHYIEYIAFCTLFLTRELCLVYEHHPNSFVKIIDKKDIDLYLDRWCYVFNISKVIRQQFASFAWEAYTEKRKKKQSRDKLMQDMKTTAEAVKDLKVTIDINDHCPQFMTANWNNSDPSKYQALEAYVWEYWEITKVKAKGKSTSLKAKKHFKYE